MKFRHSCSGCGHIFITDESNYEDLLEEMYLCTCCGKQTCEECIHLWDERDHRSNYPYLAHLGIVVCKTCIASIEGKFLIEIEDEDLPLYLSHEWLTPSARRSYHERFLQK